MNKKIKIFKLVKNRKIIRAIVSLMVCFTVLKQSENRLKFKVQAMEASKKSKKEEEEEEKKKKLKFDEAIPKKTRNYKTKYEEIKQ